ncbi:MAG: restriction endonuclease subunit S [Lutibacter sp.]|jgi:type I restriction enzyme S subunit
MSKKNKLIPEFRFPEFKNEGEWNIDKVDNLFDLQDGFSFSSFDLTNEHKESIQVIRITDINNQNKNDEKVYVSNHKIQELNISKCEVRKGDLLLSMTGAAGFNFFIWNADNGYINQRTMKIYPRKKVNESLKIIIDPLIHSKINSIGTGQNNNLSKDALKEIEFPFPIPKEQQKIASCLSSLDEVIAAHSQKLELLKNHKKGLMQNLFPQEGEKVPRYRFKEFEKYGKWRKTTIDEIAKVSAGGTPESTNPEYWNGNIPWMNSGELNNKRIYSVSNYITSKGLKESSTKLIPPNCVLIGLAGQGKTRGTAAINYIKLCTNQSIGSIHPNEDVFDSEFLYQKVDSMYEKLRYLSAGDGGRGGLNLQIIKKIELLLPNPKEQQKIASCLSSLDEIISTQVEKIKELKQHKKGLMQGLFPKTNDI